MIYRGFKGFACAFASLLVIMLMTFTGAANAEILNLPDELTVIDAQAFYGDTAIQSVVLPEGILDINQKAFANSGVVEINLPASLRYIADDAFTNAPLKNVSAVKGTYAYHWAVNHGYISEETSASLFKYSSPSNDCVSITGFVDTSSYPAEIVIPEYSPDGYLITGIGESAFSGCTGLTSVYIPGSVTSISASAFKGCSELVSLTLNEGLTAIKGTTNYVNGAFANCSKLERVTIPATVTSLGNRAFYGCSAMTSLTIRGNSDPEIKLSIGTEAFYNTGLTGTLTIPGKVSSIGSSAFQGTSISKLFVLEGANATTIGEAAFEAVTSLTSVNLAGSVTTISARAFKGCSELVSLTLNEGLTAIKGTTNYVNGAFANCVKLEKVVIPSTVTSLGNRAFYGCTALTSLTIRDSSEFQLSIGSEAFYQAGITGTLTIPAKVSAIGSGAFQGTPITKLDIKKGDYLVTIGTSAFESCANLTSATIPGNVQNINNRAFIGCALLENLTLNEGLVYIGGTVNNDNGAFTNCTSLTTVTIPSTVTHIDNRAFKNCTKLASVTFKDNSEFQMSIGTEAFAASGLAGKLSIPSKVSVIENYAFTQTSITELFIQAGCMTAIGEGAFADCPNLEKVTIPGNVQNIYARAFINCIALNDLTLNEGLVYIGGTVNNDNGAFTNCSSLTTVTIPSTVTRIENRAFKNCTSLISLTIKNSDEFQTSIGTEAFAFSGLVGKLSIPSKVSVIENYAFTQTSITELFIQAGCMTAIGEGAFADCPNLEKVTIPSNVQNIYARAFINCVALDDLTLNEGLVYIGGTVNYDNGAFTNCTSLETVTIPSTVTRIENRAFKNCTSLTSVTIKNSDEFQTSIGTEAFAASGLVGKLSIPSKVSVIENYAFTQTSISELFIEAGCMTAIGEGAFADCTLLTKVTIPSNVQNIYARAFINCVALDDLTLNEGLVYIGGTVNYDNGAFTNCISLKTVIIPSTVTRIENRAFKNCTNLVAVTFKNSDEFQMSIGTEAFAASGLVGKLSIPSRVNSIENYAFAQTAISELFIAAGDYLTNIWEGAFAECASLEKVTIPGNVQYIRERAFINCRALEILTLNEGLLYIGGTVNYDNGAFTNCSSLEKVVIPSTVTHIDNRAFKNCTSLTDIQIKALPENLRLGTEAFAGCAGIPTYIN